MHANKKDPPPRTHTKREREMERKREGPTRFVCWMRATELNIVDEREREREPESGRGGGHVLCIED